LQYLITSFFVNLLLTNGSKGGVKNEMKRKEGLDNMDSPTTQTKTIQKSQKDLLLLFDCYKSYKISLQVSCNLKDESVVIVVGVRALPPA
jgi:hypothetical protein